MDKDLNERLVDVDIEKEIKVLPERAQRAIYRIIENLDFVVAMCKETEMTDEEIEKYRIIAREKEDYMLLALLCVAKMYKNSGFETTEQQKESF